MAWSTIGRDNSSPYYGYHLYMLRKVPVQVMNKIEKDFKIKLASISFRQLEVHFWGQTHRTLITNYNSYFFDSIDYSYFIL